MGVNVAKEGDNFVIGSGADRVSTQNSIVAMNSIISIINLQNINKAQEEKINSNNWNQ